MNLGLALSGGGAKGAAHIGVLKAFEEEKIEINYIGGTSSGSIVATLYAGGYKADDIFYVVAQVVREHETRAMMDGQIHDITAVSVVIRDVTDYLESKVQTPLKAACIAAAGRVLRTVTTHVEIEFESEKLITKEDVYTLDSYGVEKAYEQF